MERLVRSLKNDFKLGVEATTDKPIVYLDPNRLDSWSVNRLLGREEGAPFTYKDLVAQKILLEQISQQLDEQRPGLSEKIPPGELLGYIVGSSVIGAFVGFEARKQGVTIVGMPKAEEYIKDTIPKTYGLVGGKSESEPADPNDPHKYIDELTSDIPFNLSHFKPFPGSTSDWQEMVGRHEGGHVNQEATFKRSLFGADLLMMNLEIQADRESLSAMKQTGRQDVADAFAMMRVISAAEGDHLHATSIFLDKEEPVKATQQHLVAAASFKDVMIKGVAIELGILNIEAADLRKVDPQRFVRALDKAIENNRFTLTQEIFDDRKEARIAEEMGLTDQEYKKLGTDKIPDILKAYDTLKSQNQFVDPDHKSNPHILEYIKSYSHAVKNLFIEDTTPEAKPEPETKTLIRKSTADVIASLTNEQMKDKAESSSMNSTTFAVAKHLGISYDEANDLREGTIEQKTQFLNVAEKLLQEDKIRATFHRTRTETEILLMNAMNISATEFRMMRDKDPNRVSTVRNKLFSAGDLTVVYDNPHMKAKIEVDLIRERQYLESQKKLELKNQEESEPADSEPEANEPESSETDTPLVSSSGSYDYLKSRQLDTGKGVPQIDLNKEDTVKMRIGELSAREYFALQSDPVLAQEQLAQKQSQTPEPAAKTDKALRITPLQLI